MVDASATPMSRWLVPVGDELPTYRPGASQSQDATVAPLWSTHFIDTVPEASFAWKLACVPMREGYQPVSSSSNVQICVCGPAPTFASPKQPAVRVRGAAEETIGTPNAATTAAAATSNLSCFLVFC